MTRSDLIARLAVRFPQLAYQDADVSVKAILDAIVSRLTAHGRVEIRGFGSFSVHTRPPRLGRNPKTGKRVPVPEKHVPHFKPGIEMQKRLNIDTKIRHIAPVDGNIFADLGSPSEQAAVLLVESDRKIAKKLARITPTNLHAETDWGRPLVMRHGKAHE